MKKLIHYSLIASVICLVTGLTSCSKDESVISDRLASDIAIITNHLDTLGVSYAVESNVYYQILTENPTGNTQEATGDILTIYYSAKVLGGSDIEVVTRENNQDSVKLRQGASAIYPIGLDIGLGLMNEGEKYIFYLPSELAFQEYSFSTLIPPNSILEIEVELVQIQSDLEQLALETIQIEDYIKTNLLDSANLISTLINGVVVDEWVLYHPLDSVKLIPEGVYYKRMLEGQSGDSILSNERVTFAYQGMNFEGEVFDEQTANDPFSYLYQSESVLSGLEAGLLQMERTEEALIIIPSFYGYGESVFVVPSYRKQDFADLDIIPSYSVKVEPFQTLVFNVQLLNNLSN